MKKNLLFLLAALFTCAAFADDVTVTVYATNSGWVYGTDYTVDASASLKDGTPVSVTLTDAATEGQKQFTMPSGATYFCYYIPSDAHKVEGYMRILSTKTTTLAANDASIQIPQGTEYVVTVPKNAEFAMGQKVNHYRAFDVIEPKSTILNDGTKTLTYMLGAGIVYNFRTWTESSATRAGYFTMNTDETKRPALAFTEADYIPSAKMIDRTNLNAPADILLNINERGHLALKKDSVFDVTAQRMWQLTDNATNNYYIDPSYHYEVTNIDGTPIEIENANTTTNPWSAILAKSKGTAIVTVTYDAMNDQFYAANKTEESNYMNGPLFSAIWPENTGVFVVTVDEPETAIVPNMFVNTAYTNTDKIAGQNVDAELDIFYYDEAAAGYEFTFSPQGVSSVTMAYPIIGQEKASYAGFGTEGVIKNADGSYTLLLKQGRQIVRLTDSEGNSTYQVLTAKSVKVAYTNTTRKDGTFQPGDEVSIQFATIYHPANKMAGIYNMSANITYDNDSYKGASNQYAFASTQAAQQISISIPSNLQPQDADIHLDGAIKVSGFGDPYGNHRLINKMTGRNANFTAQQRTAYLGVLPAISVHVDIKDIELTVVSNVQLDSLSIFDMNGLEITPDEEGKYVLNHTGEYKYTAMADGYSRLRSSFMVTDDDKQTININLTKVEGSIWDGTTQTEPKKDEQGIYLIGTGAELAWLSANSKDKSAKLTADIDMGGFDFTPIGLASATAFNGTFDGQGYSIKNLYINSTANNVGLFGYINAATIMNLEVYGQINGSSIVGGIAGYVNGKCTFTNVANHADVTGKTTYIAGIAGQVRAATTTITNAYNTGTISGTNYVGGIYNYYTTAANAEVSNVYNIGNIKGTQTGAIRGLNTATATTGKITNAYAVKAYFNDTKTTIVTNEQMASGEIAILLGDAFGQEIGIDISPVLGGEEVLYDAESDTYYNKGKEPFDTHVLTFEELDNKIDNPQYCGSLLYGDGMGFYSQEEAYQWTDSTETGLSHVLPYNWGSYCYWGGGHAVSHYVSGQDSLYGDFNSQLTVYKEGVLGIQTAQGGHDESDNFAVHYGYTDNSGFSGDVLPDIHFFDGKARVVDHMYITNTCYAINVYGNGNGLSPKISDNDWVKVLAIGYNDQEEITDTAEIYLCNGPENIVRNWTKFDLSSLGRVVRIEFNVTGSSDNGYGFSQPAYFAYDDVAVRFYEGDELPRPTPPTPTSVSDAQSSESKVQKRLYQGQIVIMCNGHVYNSTGILVR